MMTNTKGKEEVAPKEEQPATTVTLSLTAAVVTADAVVSLEVEEDNQAKESSLQVSHSAVLLPQQHPK